MFDRNRTSLELRCLQQTLISIIMGRKKKGIQTLNLTDFYRSVTGNGFRPRLGRGQCRFESCHSDHFNVRYSKWMAVNHIPSICVVVGKYLNYFISIHFWSCSVIVQCIVKDVIVKIADSNPQLYPILMGLSTIQLWRDSRIKKEQRSSMIARMEEKSSAVVDSSQIVVSIFLTLVFQKDGSLF